MENYRTATEHIGKKPHKKFSNKHQFHFFHSDPCRRLHLDPLSLDLFPVGAERSATALRVALHHRPLGVLIRILENLLEEAVESAVTTDIRIFIRRFLLLCREYVGSDALPVLLRLDRGRSHSRRGGERRKSCIAATKIKRLCSLAAVYPLTIRTVPHQCTPATGHHLRQPDFHFHLANGVLARFGIDLTFEWRKNKAFVAVRFCRRARR